MTIGPLMCPDSARAEAMLYTLALQLRRLPVNDRTHRLHVRALELKRDLARWCAEPGLAHAWGAAIAEIRALQVAATALANRARCDGDPNAPCGEAA
jgi:hypothetical protein